MFGKPEWFREKRFGWGLRAKTWQGWVYTLVWALVIAVPFSGLAVMGKWPEAIVWMACSVGALVWDAHLILREMRKSPDDDNETLMIDEQGRATSLKTRQFDMQLDDRRG